MAKGQKRKPLNRGLGKWEGRKKEKMAFVIHYEGDRYLELLEHICFQAHPKVLVSYLKWMQIQSCFLIKYHFNTLVIVI